MKQSSDDELKVNIFNGHGLQTCDQVIKRWGGGSVENNRIRGEIAHS